jgi:hypothetical protein
MYSTATLIVAAQIRCSSPIWPLQNCFVAWTSVSRLGQRAEHEAAPAQQRDEEDLPEAPELDVGEALVAEPEPAFVDHALDAEVVSGERRCDYRQRDPEEKIDEEALPFCFATARDRRSDEQAARDPTEPDPDDRRLDVEAPQEIERQEVIELHSVEGLAVVIGVGHDRARAL